MLCDTARTARMPSYSSSRLLLKTRRAESLDPGGTDALTQASFRAATHPSAPWLERCLCLNTFLTSDLTVMYNHDW